MPKKLVPISLSQIEEALEERNTKPDRRVNKEPIGDKEERRKRDRRKPAVEH
ncbi:MAG TPA: hypothetical protein PK129_06590 [Cellvibrionaceae bacterium]|nr:hypothetical protein [Cellvibrionaceae bacterium]